MDEQSQGLEMLVATTRRRLRINAILTGVGLLLFAMVAWLMLAAAVDLLLALPTPLRVAVWVGLWLIVAAVTLAAIAWPAIRPMKMESVAFLIERALGSMYNRLVTVLDIRRRNDRLAPESRPFAERLVDDTAGRLADYRVTDVADPAPMRRMTLLAGMAIVTVLSLAVAFEQRVPTALLRMIMPTRPIPPATGVEISPHPGDVTVLQNEPLLVWATVKPADVESLSLRLKPDGGKWITYPMTRETGGRFSREISAVNTSYDYQFVGGGTWTVPNRITMVRRPIVEEIRAEVRLPEYMGLPEPRPVHHLNEQISAPLGSTARVLTEVSGDAAEGRINLYRAATETAEQTLERETVWFDDDVPPDAELLGNWRWITETVHSGTRAHTFGWAKETYGFKTRLNSLEISQGESLFIYVRVDPQQPADRLTVSVPVGKRRHELVWDSPLRPLKEGQKKKLQYAGQLPTPGEWQRLEVPVEDIVGHKPKNPVDLEGMSFEVDDGRIVFDRAGTVRKMTESVAQTNLELLGVYPMHRDEASGLWVGEIPVDRDGRFTVELKNRLGHASASMKAVPVVATTDQPPSLVVERPGRSLSIAEPQPVPLVVRAFDDYGVAGVSIQFGDKPDTFGDPRPLAAYDQPRTSRMVMGALDPTTLELKPGESIYYRLMVRDRKDQQVISDPYRLGLASPGEKPEETDAGPNVFGGIMEGIGKLIDFQGRLLTDAAELIGGLGSLPEVEVDPDGKLTLLNLDGTPMTGEQIRQLLEEWNANLTEEDRRKLAELNEQIAEERQRMLEMAGEIEEAAEVSEESALALPLEAEALRAMAEHARDLAELMPPGQEDFDGLDEDVLARLSRLQELSPDQQEEMALLQQQLRAMQDARQQLAGSPEQARQQIESLLARMQSQQAMQEMNQLGDYLQSEQQALQQMRRQVEQLSRQTEQADAPAMDQISRAQQELDPEALALIDRARELMKQRAEQKRDNEISTPPAPWVPPGKEVEAMPVEADTPEEDPAEEQPADPDAMERKLDEMAEQVEEEENWWDQPVDVPPTPFTREPSERFADRDTRPTEAPDPRRTNEMFTPRQMLQEHQDQLHQALTANSNEMATAQGELSSMMSQLQQAMQEAGPQQQVTGRQPGQQPPQGMSGQQQSATQQMQEMLSSAAMQQAMAMATQAARQQQQQGQSQGQDEPADAMGQMMAAPSGGGTLMGQAPARPGQVIEVDFEALGITPESGAGLYRLPPRVRQPLMQGMNEKGPEAYQSMIDAYYRKLSENVEVDN